MGVPYFETDPNSCKESRAQIPGPSEKISHVSAILFCGGRTGRGTWRFSRFLRSLWKHSTIYLHINLLYARFPDFRFLQKRSTILPGGFIGSQDSWKAEFQLKHYDLRTSCPICGNIFSQESLAVVFVEQRVVSCNLLLYPAM